MSKTFRILVAAFLVAYLAFQVTASAEEFIPVKQVQAPAQAVPNTPLALSFYQYAISRNEAARQAAVERARPGKSVTVVQDTSNTVISGGTVYSDYGHGLGLPYVGTYQQTPTYSNTTRGTYSRTFEISPYGGGPLYIINPFCPPPEKQR